MCLSTEKGEEMIMILCVHVDDVLVGGESGVSDALCASLLQEFQTKPRK